MPMYEYVCGSCRHSFEQIQSFNDEPLTLCPECGGPVRRVISSVGIIFKGSGWYINDSRRQITTSKTKDTESAKNGGDVKAADGAVAEPAAASPKDESSSTATPAASDTAKTSAGSEGASKPDKPAVKESAAKS